MDFYRYREEIKRIISHRVNHLLDTKWDPFAASWLAYALSQEGFDANLLLQRLLERLHHWTKESNVWYGQKNIGPLCFLAYFSYETDPGEAGSINQILDRIMQLCRETNHKFSPLNDPEQMFPISLLISSRGDESYKQTLMHEIRQHLRGPLKRRILYTAALRELDETVSLEPSNEELSVPGSIIAMVWFGERYAKSGNRETWWARFESIRETISFDLSENIENAYALSVTEIAMLYEALIRATNNPDPNLLFDLYPLHPLVKDIARKFFREGNYVHAVLEAAKAFESRLKRLTGLEKTCRSLVQESMKKDSPIIQFNSLQTQSEQQEQEGLRLISEGICAAFRNPKAHDPINHPAIQLDAFDALDQLIVISHILKRIDRAEIVTSSDQSK